jgi:hypothetical protein
MPPKKKPAAKAAAEKPTPTMLAIRGLTLEDHAALMRAVARRKAAIGAYVSLNAAVLGLLRAGLAREDASGVIDVVDAPRTEGT